MGEKSKSVEECDDDSGERKYGKSGKGVEKGCGKRVCKRLKNEKVKKGVEKVSGKVGKV